MGARRRRVRRPPDDAAVAPLAQAMTVRTVRAAAEDEDVISGHVDVVDAGDRSRWSSSPFEADVATAPHLRSRRGRHEGRDRRRSSALEALAAPRVRPAGDVVFETVPDEETCAMGTVAAIARGYRADAGLVPEPTRLDLWIATRGLLHGTLTVEGRSAHAEMNQPHWREVEVVSA